MESELICGSLTVDFNAALPALTHQVSLPDGTRAATLRYVQTAWNHWTWELAADTCARRGSAHSLLDALARARAACLEWLTDDCQPAETA